MPSRENPTEWCWGEMFKSGFLDVARSVRPAFRQYARPLIINAGGGLVFPAPLPPCLGRLFAVPPPGRAWWGRPGMQLSEARFNHHGPQAAPNAAISGVTGPFSEFGGT